MDAPGRDNTSLRDALTDAIRFWERGRIFYNAVLAVVVLGSIARTWPLSRDLLLLASFLPLFVLAVIANICYTSAYLIDLPVQLSGFRSSWQRWRWVLWLIGTAFAAVLAFYWMGDEVVGS